VDNKLESVFDKVTKLRALGDRVTTQAECEGRRTFATGAALPPEVSAALDRLTKAAAALGGGRGSPEAMRSARAEAERAILEATR